MEGFLILPGTHSKWVKIKNQQIESFSTHMTGEMLQVLKAHSILGAMMKSNLDHEESFLKGVERASSNSDLLSLLFSVRTEGLFEQIKSEYLASYLSGILIGSEISAENRTNGFLPVGIIGDEKLANLYKVALRHLGYKDVSLFNGNTISELGLWSLEQYRKNK
jgi:2-dehydro-3-deoxygalactonokinase